MADQYWTRDVTWPWIGADGAFAGFPVIRLRLGKCPGARPMLGHDIGETIRGLIPLRQDDRPRWVYVEDDASSRFDNDLILIIRTLLALRVAIATDGAAPMNSGDEKLPLYDHVVLRLKMPVAAVYTQLFHSVVIVDGFTKSAAIELSGLFRRIAYNGPRYVLAPAGPIRADLLSDVSGMGGEWRVTQALLSPDVGGPKGRTRKC